MKNFTDEFCYAAERFEPVVPNPVARENRLDCAQSALRGIATGSKTSPMKQPIAPAKRIEAGPRTPAGQTRRPGPPKISAGSARATGQEGAARLSQENSRGEPKAQTAAQGGNPTEAARAAGVVGVPRSANDLPESKTGGERRRGTWDKARGHSEGRDDGRAAVATLFDRITTPPKVQQLHRVLYCKAKAESGYRFYSLYGELLWRDLIETAMSAVASHGGAAGVDGQACSAYLRSDEAWQQWRDRLLEELRTKTYRASPVRRVRIPKGDGKTRLLGVPTVKNRVVQTAVAMLLLPVWEADSHPQSYTYRPKRNAHQAMDAIGTVLRSGRTEVIDADGPGQLRDCAGRALAAED